jgi:uncharacterized lipoprotein NlpE involved in copper resistance
MSSRTRRIATLGIAALAALLALSGCSNVRDVAGGAPAAATTPTPTAKATPAFDSQFTRDGTFQSHLDIDGIDFVYTLYPTKSTPRTNLWFPKGKKYFSVTFQAYDLDQGIRDSFTTKRKVWLDEIVITTSSVTTSGNSEEPYDLDDTASHITFDPQPTKGKYGMLITSPKGAFELRNQEIGELAADTRGVDLLLRATVHIQRSPGSKSYTQEVIRQKVPIAIFASTATTKVARIPVDAN